MGKSMEVPHNKFIIKLLCNPAIPLLGIYLKKMKTLAQNGICTPLFIVTLFMIVKITNGSNLCCLCSLINEWIKNINFHTHTHRQ